MSLAADIITAAIARGIDPTTLTSETHDALLQECISVQEAVKGGFKQKTAAIKTYMGVGLVPLWVSENNLKQCRKNECGMYGVLSDGVEICNECQCKGPDLYNKVRQKGQHCPHRRRFWDNRKVKITIRQTDAQPS